MPRVPGLHPGMKGLTVPRSFYGLGWGTQAEPQEEPQGIR